MCISVLFIGVISTSRKGWTKDASCISFGMYIAFVIGVLSVDNTWHQHPGLQCHQRQFRHAGSCVGNSQLQDKIQVKEAGEIAASNETPG